MSECLENPKSLKPNEEQRYVEGAYEDINAYDLKESEAKLEYLEKLQETVLNEGPNTGKCPKTERRTKNTLFAKAIIDSCGVGISEFSSTKGPDYYAPKKPEASEVEGTSEDECKNPNEKIQRHPNTMRKYTAILLSFFSNLETEYVTEDGRILTKKLPIIYGTREKLISIEQHEFSQLLNGNTNFVPRASLVIDSIVYDNTRQINKSSNVSSTMSMTSLAAANPYAETQAAPSPYNVNIRMNIVTRGMNDALMLAEQVGSVFNPFAAITMREFDGGPETSVRLKLEGITFEPPEMDEFSQNEVLSEYTFTLYGNLYRPGGFEYLANNINVNFNMEL